MPVSDHSHALLTALYDRTSFLFDQETVSTEDAGLRFIANLAVERARPFHNYVQLDISYKLPANRNTQDDSQAPYQK
jgi:hypothetical protein